MADAQALVGQAVTLEVTWADDLDTPTDPDAQAVTVTVTDPDGTELITAAAATRTSIGVYAFELGPQPEVTLLTAVWSATVGGAAETRTTTAEIVGDLLFTVAQARAFNDAALADETAYPAAAIVAKRISITDDFEAIGGWSFVPRHHRMTVSGSGSDRLLADHGRILRVLSATADGATIDPAVVAAEDGGVLVRTDGGVWPRGRHNLTITYAHGWPRAPGPIRRAALTVARAQLVATNVSDRTTSFTDEAGTWTLATAGRPTGRGDLQHYGLPEVDSILNRREYMGRVPGVA